MNCRVRTSYFIEKKNRSLYSTSLFSRRPESHILLTEETRRGPGTENDNRRRHLSPTPSLLSTKCLVTILDGRRACTDFRTTASSILRIRFTLAFLSSFAYDFISSLSVNWNCTLPDHAGTGIRSRNWISATKYRQWSMQHLLRPCNRHQDRMQPHVLRILYSTMAGIQFSLSDVPARKPKDETP